MRAPGPRHRPAEDGRTESEASRRPEHQCPQSEGQGGADGGADIREEAKCETRQIGTAARGLADGRGDGASGGRAEGRPCSLSPVRSQRAQSPSALAPFHMPASAPEGCVHSYMCSGFFRRYLNEKPQPAAKRVPVEGSARPGVSAGLRLGGGEVASLWETRGIRL